MTDLSSKVMPSLQRALLGNVVSRMRGVTCDWKDKAITIRFIFDGEFSDDDEEMCSEVETEVMADFPWDWTFDLQVVRHDYPKPLSELLLKRWAYARWEPSDDASG